jgi:transcription antitermination factor NusG
MAQAKFKTKEIKKGDKVKITGGEHDGKVGELKHIRAATADAHVELADTGKMVLVKLADLAAA